jgi:hypothetical protein
MKQLLQSWLVISTLVMCTGTIALAFFGAPRLDAKLTEPARPLSMTQAAYGMVGFAIVAAVVIGIGIRHSQGSTTAPTLITAIAVTIGAVGPWVLLLRSV